MKLCYQVATPDVARNENVTAYQGDLETSFSRLSQYGYDGVELMTRDPDALDWCALKLLADKNKLSIELICTGEVYGQAELCFTAPEEKKRLEAIERVCRLIDYAHACDAKLINVGRVRGFYRPNISAAQTDEWAIEAFRYISDYAAKKDISVALENVTIMQTNFINRIEEAVNMVERVKRDNFRIMMDVFHMNIEEKNIIETIKRYISYNVYVHLADKNRRYPGQSGLDFLEIIGTFFDCGYNGPFSTEIYQYPDQDTAARKTIEYLAPIFERVYGCKPRNIFCEKEI